MYKYFQPSSADLPSPEEVGLGEAAAPFEKSLVELKLLTEERESDTLRLLTKNGRESVVTLLKMATVPL